MRDILFLQDRALIVMHVLTYANTFSKITSFTSHYNFFIALRRYEEIDRRAYQHTLLLAARRRLRSAVTWSCQRISGRAPRDMRARRHCRLLRRRAKL